LGPKPQTPNPQSPIPILIYYLFINYKNCNRINNQLIKIKK
jgi:hypothetical protein